MSEAMHPAAPHHLPPFITGPGETDVLFTGSVIFLVLAVMRIGSLYFWLHSLPERMSHGGSQIQFQLVGVLSLLALFTHIHAFWIAALFLALVPRARFLDAPGQHGRLARQDGDEVVSIPCRRGVP
jgi:hypothetical protein